MVGTVDGVRTEKNELLLNVSDWMIEEKGKQPFVGYSYLAQVTENTVIQMENGKKVRLDQIQKGQRVKVLVRKGEKEKGTVKKITLLKMSRKEKLGFLLPPEGSFNLVVMYTGSKDPGNEFGNLGRKLDKPARDEIQSIIYRPYEASGVMDFKKAFTIRKFPAVLVFDQKGLVFKTYSFEKLHVFLVNHTD